MWISKKLAPQKRLEIFLMSDVAIRQIRRHEAAQREADHAERGCGWVATSSPSWYRAYIPLGGSPTNCSDDANAPSLKAFSAQAPNWRRLGTGKGGSGEGPSFRTGQPIITE